MAAGPGNSKVVVKWKTPYHLGKLLCLGCVSGPAELATPRYHNLFTTPSYYILPARLLTF